MFIKVIGDVIITSAGLVIPYYSFVFLLIRLPIIFHVAFKLFLHSSIFFTEVGFLINIFEMV